MNPSDTSIARDRTRRINSVFVYARSCNDSGRKDPSPIENPGQPDPPSDLSDPQYARQPELPRCVTSRSSGVTSGGSRGCVTSTGTPFIRPQPSGSDNFAVLRYEFST